LPVEHQVELFRNEAIVTNPDIFAAIAEPDLAVLQAMIKADPSAVHLLDDNGMPPLYHAALYRNSAAIDFLIVAGARLDIFACCYLERNDEGQKLLEENADLVREKTQACQTPLHLAARKGNVELARTLIEVGADVNAKDSNGKTPLLEAAHGGPWKPSADLELIELLINHGAIVSLQLAAAIGRDDLVAIELDKEGVACDDCDDRGYTALFQAAHNNQLACVELLLERGATADFNCDDETALSAAALHLLSQQCDPQICRMLIAHGAVFDIHTAAALGDIAQMQRLIADDKNVIHSEIYDFTPADYAVHCGQLESLRLLLDSGFDPNRKNSIEESLLPKCEHLPELRDLLIARGAT
jgi:ankyrin repeat protein